jgi:hypothetical protein
MAKVASDDCEALECSIPSDPGVSRRARCVAAAERAAWLSTCYANSVTPSVADAQPPPARAYLSGRRSGGHGTPTTRTMHNCQWRQTAIKIALLRTCKLR